ncbi:hypothetical protein GLOIN_2v1783661 [Rhizophagus irregularis DAOM 181602=DAOM 197198]|nr:hypothetical protein GLOIN_2v1783661 [Rhizophagus irregularis DAOM 181602=DAOM 197198]
MLFVNLIHYIVDWELTWFTLNFKPSHDASFTPEHASRHLTFKFKLFLDDLPTLEKLKRTRPDLYMDELTCRSSSNLVDTDPTPFIAKLTSLSCWSFSSTNWSSFALIRGCLPKLFIDLFVDLSIPRTSAIKVIAAIHNNFLKTTPKPSNLPLSTYIPYSSLPPPTLHDSRDSGTDWLKNSMKYGLPCRRAIRYFVSIVASTLETI